jgi:hypothetical protein
MSALTMIGRPVRPERPNGGRGSEELFAEPPGKEQTIKNLTQIHKNLKHAGPAFLLAAVMLSMAACATTSSTASDKVQLMFVQIAEDVKVDPAAGTFRLVKVNQQTVYFSDRPERIAGHMNLARYLEEWTSKAGKDSFKENPPNAVLSVYERGKPDNTLAALKIMNPVVDGPDLVYSYKLIEGNLPAGGGATALFIDWIGVGGGVGRGFHGVGVGFRGPGWRGW